MRRTSDWIGLPVIDLKTGTTIGKVTDVLFAHDDYAFALILERGGLLFHSRAILLTDIHSLGPDAVTIESPERIKVIENLGRYRCLMGTETRFVGKQMVREDGFNLGTVVDVYVASDSDKIVGYEASDGLIGDLLHGRRRVPFEATLEIGEAILVKNGVALEGI
ncbi:hypothetical protein DNHGIG_02110 [Collibacillus ludicampi]|jgi:uncharacterized protein YrrD|uniref:PRC-barrel domain-containing protein n=1 Tax=Collibacillus ludicampi TaxID=2771369 RepID=A0AAV4LA20_9BACL|nr:PRC-barrel domain-containing protein [Collibacillus ludicampi]GIM44662.1 hypothetical protein DNHGIG_02110 [Collibacillus ludicampi]